MEIFSININYQSESTGKMKKSQKWRNEKFQKKLGKNKKKQKTKNKINFIN